MDGYSADHRLLAGFLAGDLGPAEAGGWDERLLAGEQCWKAVREDRAGRQAAAVLRQPAPADLADRVAFAVEVAGAGGTADRLQARLGARSGRRARPPRRRARHGRRRRARLAGAGGLAAGPVVPLLLLPLPARPRTRRLPP